MKHPFSRLIPLLLAALFIAPSTALAAMPAPVQLAFSSTAQTTATSVNTGSGGADTTPFPSNCTAGNLIFYSVVYDGSGGGSQPTVAVTDSQGNTYTKIGSFFNPTNATYSEFGYARNISGGATTVTATFSGSSIASAYFKGIAALEISGLDTAAPFTTAEFAIANTTAAASAGFNTGNTPTLAESNGFMVGVASQIHDTNGPASAGSGFTQFGSAFWNFGTGVDFGMIETQQLTSDAAQAATFTAGSNGLTGIAYTAVFKPASAPAPFAPIALNSGANQINLGTGANTGSGDPLLTAFGKLAQDDTDLNIMVDQLFPNQSVQTPVTGFSITPAQAVTRLILNPAGTLATGTVTLPANPGDDQPFEVMTSQTITAITFTPAAGQTLNSAPTTLPANKSAEWRFIAPLNAWFRVR
jgi:hypothetical protein